jgi:hypothetical protein
MRTEKAAYNSTFAIGGVSCSADSLVLAESFVLRIKFSGENPPIANLQTVSKLISPTVIGGRVKAARKAKKITVRQLGEMCDTDYSNLSRFETGK